MGDLSKTRWFSWTRLAGLAVTAGLFYFTFQKVDGVVLVQAFQRMHGWLAMAAFILCGLAHVLGGMRWHLTLRLTDRVTHAGASLRLLFVGQFFYVALFGAAGGDVAKSVVYSRWFRYPLPEVLATAPLDRGLGSVGMAAILLFTLALASAVGGFDDLTAVRWKWTNTLWFFVAGAVALLLLGLFLWKPQRESPWSRALDTFKTGARNLFRIPQLGGKAMVCSFLHQAATIGVFALSLMAVAREPLPWPQLAWTMPAVTILSCFPISIAGAGVREVAAVTLLGLYGVPPVDAVAAAMLTLVIKLLWAGVGGWVFWREHALQERCQFRSGPATISVVIPAFNEAEALPDTLARLRVIAEVREIILVDGGSTDATIRAAEKHGCRVLRTGAARGSQLRLGAAQAAGDVVLMLHADTWLPREAGRAVLDCLRDKTVVGGGFWKVFRDPPLLMYGSRFRCAVRLWISQRVAGDQALFVRREVLEEIGGVPDMALMEEFALCDRLNEVGRLALAGAKIQTSTRRFHRNGLLRTYALMGWVHLLYRLGYPPSDLKRIYDNGRLELPHKRPAAPAP